MPASSNSRSLGFPVAFAIWACLVTVVAFFGVWGGYGGRRFALALGVAALLFAFEFFLAVPSAMTSVRGVLADAAALAAVVPLASVAVYSLTVAGGWKTALFGTCYVAVPLLLLASNVGRSKVAWQDYAAALCLWLPIWTRWLYMVFPYPEPLTHVLSILLALSTGVASFLLLRRLEGTGYAIDWRRGYALHFVLCFVIFAAMAIPFGLRIHFIEFAPSLHRLKPLVVVGILFFTAWPEEFLFRGVLQNLLSRTLANDWAGLVTAAILFGFSHINQGAFPNWKYVLLASLAGFFYGLVWMRTKSLVPGALMHALVDITWHVLFR